MQESIAPARPRRVVLVGLIAGPALVAASSLFLRPPAGPSTGALFDSVAADPGAQLAQTLLEAVGFTLAFAAFAAAGMAVAARGRTLGACGASLAVLGILGFGLTAGRGTTLNAVAQMSDRAAGVAALDAVGASGPSGLLALVCMLAGEVGVCLVVGALMRAGIVRVWPLLLLIAATVVSSAFDAPLAIGIADLLLLAAGVWVAVRLVRPRASARATAAKADAEPTVQAAGTLRS